MMQLTPYEVHEAHLQLTKIKGEGCLQCHSKVFLFMYSEVTIRFQRYRTQVMQCEQCFTESSHYSERMDP